MPAVGELWILDQILAICQSGGSDIRCLELFGELLPLFRRRPGSDSGVELIFGRLTLGVSRETPVVQTGIRRHLLERLPGSIVHRDRDPAVLAGRRIDAMRRVIGVAIFARRPDPAVCGVIQNGWSEPGDGT